MFIVSQYGRQNIENVKKRNGTRDADENLSIEEGCESPTIMGKNSTVTSTKAQNGCAGNTVIARSKNFILVPEPEMHNHKNDVEESNLTNEQQETSTIDEVKEDSLNQKNSFETLKAGFAPTSCLDYIRAGVEAIIEDEVTSRFEAEELKVMWLTVCTAVVGYVPEGSFKRWLNSKVSLMCFAVLSSALSAVIKYNNPENRPVAGICVANHTSPIDVLVLMCDNCYSLIGQRHGGFLGVLQRALARASPHIWFERSEVKDREAVAKRLKKHVSDPTNPPILIFPEGTCINNTSVMQFKKGSFEVDSIIYPVAIKYDPRFGDAFWNSSRYSMIQYLYMMMSSWAIVCDVWYLPPMYRKEGESAIDFANRVKSVIARQGGLVDLQWDGQLKRMKPKKEWREKQQEEFSKRFKAE
ncbi:glycerol-3-phosphate acyltransferase 3-like isoform 3 protein [Lasius niger]|uniref:Glycerol-3-phosphate acyltransferase 3-like isoform 3 protein n=1 Tax=Lasius niger TaxID=67767 RepID=A0A0J7L5L0_LASNI|nr:glycerol-3-phosphate acyltransferase 3-like isoform 3 protein [Lasius niger]